MRILLTIALILLGPAAWAQNTQATQDTKAVPDDFLAKMASDLAALATAPHPSAAQKSIPDDFLAKMASDLAALATEPHSEIEPPTSTPHGGSKAGGIQSR
jgi:hypothetical protein